jgi:hypothetical protein
MTGARKLWVAFAVCAAVLGVIAQAAQATHVRPKGATPLYVPLTVAYNECTAANRVHAAPLAFPSCNPPVAASPNVTVGTPDANGAAANFTGAVRFKVIAADVALNATIVDVRCKAGTATCGSANAQDGADYTGELQGSSAIRVTDHHNGPFTNPTCSPTPCTDPATGVDVGLNLTVPCVASADTSIGGSCSLATSVNTLIPTAISSGQREVIQSGQLIVNDGGPDGTAATTDNSPFLVQGLFTP